MAERDIVLLFLDHETRYQRVYFVVKLLAGNVLFGSAIAYKILAQQDVELATTALTLFFVSLVVFGAANVPAILIYGRYTVIVSIICMVPVLATGRTLEPDLLPFLSMLAVFLTLGWPYLEDSRERLFSCHRYGPCPADEWDSGPLPLEQIYVDPRGDHPNGPLASRQARPRELSPVTLGSEPAGMDAPISPGAIMAASFLANARNLSNSPSGVSELLLHIGGAGARSGRSTPSNQSISLSAVTGRVPSDVSSNVLRLLGGHNGQGESRANENRTPRVSQRVADILDLFLVRSGHLQEGDTESSLVATADAPDDSNAPDDSSASDVSNASDDLHTLDAPDFHAPPSGQP